MHSLRLVKLSSRSRESDGAGGSIAARRRTTHTVKQGVVKVFLELSNKNCDHGSHIPEVQLGEVSRLKLRV